MCLSFAATSDHVSPVYPPPCRHSTTGGAPGDGGDEDGDDDGGDDGDDDADGGGGPAMYTLKVARRSGRHTASHLSQYLVHTCDGSVKQRNGGT